MGTLLQDLRFTIRRLIHSPGFTLIVVLTLALGIGVNTAMFSLFHQVMLQPLAVPEPERLVLLSSTGPKSGSVSCSGMGDCEQVFSYPMLRDLQREQTVFTAIAAHRGFGASISVEGSQAVRSAGVAVNGTYFSVLQLAPALGRLIGPQDEPRVGEGRVAVLAYDYWQNHFGGSPAVLGEILTINGQPMAVIGVAPKGFSGASPGLRPQVFVPLTMYGLMEMRYSQNAENRRSYWVYLFARLKPGVTAQQAEQAIIGPYQAIIRNIEAPLQTEASNEYLANFKDKELLLQPGTRGQSSALDDMSLPLILLLSVTTLVLLSACVNIANLVLARGIARAREMALRSAIGASRGQLLTQLLMEAGLLAFFGYLAAFPVAIVTLKLMSAHLLIGAAGNLDVHLSQSAILFSVSVTLVTTLLFGLFPALVTTRVSPSGVLKEQSGQQSGGRGMARFRRSLVTAQIAFSMLLLVLALLFAQSLANVAREDLGLKAESVVTFSVAPQLNGFSMQNSTTLFRRIEDKLAALPGVTSVASSMVPILSGSNWGTNVSVEGFVAGPDTDDHAYLNEVSPGFFRTLHIPLLAGRDFTDADLVGRPKVAIVNEAFAKKFGLGHEVVGTRMARGAGGALDIQIVGLVADAKYSRVKQEVPPQFFTPRYQNEELGFMNFYVRSSLAPKNMLTSISQTVQNLAADLPVDNLKTLPDVIADNTYLDRMISMLSGGFALLATLLAALGLYGVLSYSVARRTRELGVRQALGATPQRLRGMVLRQIGWMALIGSAIGLVLAVLLGRAAESILFGISGYDPVALAAATVLLGAVVIAAGYLPARRATRVNPTEALRYE